jgi:hypothetical protein
VRADVRVVYLGGLGRSGSTLLERLLGELRGVRACGEVVHLWQRGIEADERCGCGSAFSVCEFWSKVGAVAFGGWDQVDLDRVGELRDAVDRTRFIPRMAGPGLPPQARRTLDEYTGYYLKVYQAAAEVSGCATLVDSSKHASLAFCLSRRPEIDLRVIHLVRDSRAVAYSWTTKVARPEGGSDSYMTTYPPMSAAAHWNAQNGALQLLARRGARVLRVRYEDLVASPEATLAEVAAFAGLSPQDASLAFSSADGSGRSVVLGEAHTVSGNPMRFSSGSTTIRGDDRWRTAMPYSQRRAVTALTLPLLTHYGYAWRAA